eukprot:7092684-Lingulodinium_polyedra.AAC.1
MHHPYPVPMLSQDPADPAVAFAGLAAGHGAQPIRAGRRRHQGALPRGLARRGYPRCPWHGSLLG